MKTKILFTLIAFWLFTAGSCNDDDDDDGNRLPSITQTGANTAGYKLDGKVIIPDKKLSWTSGPSPSNPLKGDILNDSLFISIFNEEEKNDDIIKSITKKLYIETSLRNNSFFKCYMKKSIYGEMIPEHQNYSMIEGNLDFLKKDENSGIYAGTFNAKLKHEETGEILNITDGRFDINLNTLNKD
ncbi:MAG: hypothetical protein ACR2MS_06705 [Weeksellaceae bacterium]